MTGIGLDRVGVVILSAVADATARTLVIAALAAALLMVWRRASAARQLLVWTTVLYASLVLPLLVVVVPAKVVTPASVPIVSTAWTQIASPAEALRVRARAFFTSSDAAAAEVGRPASSRSAAPRRLTWTAGVWLLYAAGVVSLMLGVLRGWLAARRLGRGTPIASPAVIAMVERHARRLGIARPPRIIEQPLIAVPMTTGMRRPVIALPTDWREWPGEAMQAVVVHELSHVARRDARTQALSHLNRALGWVNPCSWWLHRTLADLAEQASDDAALDAGVSQTTYAETLLTFAQRLPVATRGPAWAVAMARRRGVATERRIDRVLAWYQGSSRPIGVGTRAAIALGAGAVLLVAASVRLDATRAARGLAPMPVRTASGVALDTRPSASVTAQAPNVRRLDEQAVRAAKTRTLASAAQAPMRIPSGFGAGAYRPGAGLTNPVMVRAVEARYTAAALARKIEGGVELEAVILADGTVGDIRVVRSLDSTDGLDDAAVAAARQWVFQPARLNGVPVPIVVALQVSFHPNDAAQVAGQAQSTATAPMPLRDDFAQGAYWMGATGLVAPVLVAQVEPKYTAQAMRDRIQGDAVVELIVMPDGSVGKTRIAISLDAVDGLDDNALAAAQAYRFKPGLLNGQAVPVLVTISLNFRLH